MKPLAILMLLVLMVGCARERSTPIIEKVEMDGAGDVKSASELAIQDWMRKKGSAYADEIWKMCTPVAQRSVATWRDSTEGRICAAADALRLFHMDAGTLPGDKRTFQGGSK